MSSRKFEYPTTRVLLLPNLKGGRRASERLEEISQLIQVVEFNSSVHTHTLPLFE